MAHPSACARPLLAHAPSLSAPRPALQAPGRRPRLSQVQSKIKAQVLAARQAAAAAQRQRARLVGAAVATADGGAREEATAAAAAHAAGMRSGSVAAEAAAASGAAAVADRFLSNPWSSYFLQPGQLPGGSLVRSSRWRSPRPLASAGHADPTTALP